MTRFSTKNMEHEMIAITFLNFYKQNYKDKGYSLYVVRDNENVLYVGISRKNVWERWFGQLSSHMTICKVGSRHIFEGHSRIGEKIKDNYPESLSWIVELWTEKDCVKYLSKFYKDKSQFSCLQGAEEKMIERLRPLYNVQNSEYGNFIPRTEKEKILFKKLGDVYDAIFNRKGSE